MVQFTRTGAQRSRLTHTVAVAGVVMLLLASLFSTGSAAESNKTITLGESLSDAQRQELLDFFEAGSNDRVVTVTTAETIEAMEGMFPPGSIQSAFSSTALTCRDLGEGLAVSTRNIDVVTPDLFAIALVTAGIGDATLVVAAPDGASAKGMTAMAGIFKTWEIAPCDSGSTNKARQRLAFEQIAIAAEIGQALIGTGVADGMQRAGNVVLEAQKTIVTDRLKDPAEIEAAIVAQEQVQGITVLPEMHAKLVDLMTRLANEKIDWSTFAAGWSIERNGATSITMTGDGIAIRDARKTATAQAAAEQTAAAADSSEFQTAAAGTAAAEAMAATGTARAIAAADSASATAAAAVRATERASAAMTATAELQPSPTVTPTPTATPGPVTTTGKITGVGGNEIQVAAKGSDAPSAFTLAPDAAVTRDGKAVDLGQLQPGDSVTLTVDGMTRMVVHAHAETPPTPLLDRINPIVLLVLTGGMLGAFLCVRIVNREDPFIVTLQLS